MLRLTLAIAGLEPSAPTVYLSAGGLVVVAVILAVAVTVRRARYARAGDAVVGWPEERDSPRPHPAPTTGPAGIVAAASVEPPPPAPPSVDPTVGGSVSTPGPQPSSIASLIEPAIALTAPGAGILGRLRRRPLADRGTVRRLRAAPTDHPGPEALVSGGDGPAVASGPKARSPKSPARAKATATSVPSKKARAGSARSPGTSANPGPSHPSSRARQASGGGSSAGKRAGAVGKAVER